MNDISGKNIAILVHNYFEQAEFEEPWKALQDAGGEVTILSASGKSLQALNHVDKGDTFTADLLLKEASAQDYDALVLPGGAINADNLRIDKTAQEWVLDFLDSGRVVAVICHAPWVLVSADAVEGRRLTSFHTIRDDITNAGGEWVDLAVVVDDNLITSRKPDDLPKFNDAIISLLNQQYPGVLQTGSDNLVADDEITDEDEEDILDDMDSPDELRTRNLVAHTKNREED